MRSTAEVLDHHMKCFADRDLDAILANYAADAVFFGPEGASARTECNQACIREIVRRVR